MFSTTPEQLPPPPPVYPNLLPWNWLCLADLGPFQQQQHNEEEPEFSAGYDPFCTVSQRVNGGPISGFANSIRDSGIWYCRGIWGRCQREGFFFKSLLARHKRRQACWLLSTISVPKDRLAWKGRNIFRKHFGYVSRSLTCRILKSRMSNICDELFCFSVIFCSPLQYAKLPQACVICTIDLRLWWVKINYVVVSTDGKKNTALNPHHLETGVNVMVRCFFITGGYKKYAGGYICKSVSGK